MKKGISLYAVPTSISRKPFSFSSMSGFKKHNEHIYRKNTRKRKKEERKKRKSKGGKKKREISGERREREQKSKKLEP